jgi:hypothetical protein
LLICFSKAQKQEKKSSLATKVFLNWRTYTLGI